MKECHTVIEKPKQNSSPALSATVRLSVLPGAREMEQLGCRAAGGPEGAPMARRSQMLFAQIEMRQGCPWRGG